MHVSRRWAKDYYGLPGAYFPHSAYPVEMTMNPYPVPSWGWEICETPWTVQGLWFHYLYSQDREFLEQRAYEPIREAVAFLVAYMQRPEARGPQWGDDKLPHLPHHPARTLRAAARIPVQPRLHGRPDADEVHLQGLPGGGPGAGAGAGRRRNCWTGSARSWRTSPTTRPPGRRRTARSSSRSPASTTRSSTTCPTP